MMKSRFLSRLFAILVYVFAGQAYADTYTITFTDESAFFGSGNLLIPIVGTFATLQYDSSSNLFTLSASGLQLFPAGYLINSIAFDSNLSTANFSAKLAVNAGNVSGGVEVLTKNTNNMPAGFNAQYVFSGATTEAGRLTDDESLSFSIAGFDPGLLFQSGGIPAASAFALRVNNGQSGQNSATGFFQGVAISAVPEVNSGVLFLLGTLLILLVHYKRSFIAWICRLGFAVRLSV